MPVDTLPPFADHTGSIDPALAGGDLAWLTRLRAQGLERYRTLGLPTPRVEDWKYTNLKALAGIDFAPAAEAPDQAAPTTLPEGLKVDAIRLVVVNGRFRPDLSAPDGLPDGVEAGGLAQMLARDPAAIEAHLGQIAVLDGMPMLALNTAMMTDGFVLRLAAGVELDRPIHVLFVGAAGDRALACHPRNLIVAQPGSRVTVFESHVGAGAVPTFGNVVTEVTVGEGAVLNHYKLHDEPAAAFHLATTRVALDNDSVYDSFVLSVGGRLSRHELRVSLGGGGIDCRLNGAYVIAGDQHVDNTIFVDHAAPGSRSRQHYKGVLDDTARGVFQGKILVRRQAQQTDGHQLNRALLLSPGAEVDCKPELEIYADDVKCGHGAAIGEIEEAPLFYLQARGIDRDAARDLLVEAFIGEVVDEIAVEGARQAFRDVVAGWLATRRRSRGKNGAGRP